MEAPTLVNKSLELNPPGNVAVNGGRGVSTSGTLSPRCPAVVAATLLASTVGGGGISARLKAYLAFPRRAADSVHIISDK